MVPNPIKMDDLEGKTTPIFRNTHLKRGSLEFQDLF